MNRTLSKFLQITLPLALGFFLIWYIYNSFTPEQLSETKNHFSQADYRFVILAAILNIFSHLLRAYRWKFLLQPLGYHSKSANNFMALSVGYLFNLLIPRSGEVSRAVLIDKYEKIPFQKGFGTIISERVVDLFFLAFFTALALFLEYEALSEYILEHVPFSALLTLVVVGGIILLGIFLFFRFSNSQNRIKIFLSGIKEGILSILKMKNKTAFIFQTILIWVLYILAFYTVFQALPQTADVPFGTIVIGFVAGGFVITFTNSGFGSYPFAMAAILSIFGIAKTVGIAFGWIVWISNILTTVLIGVISMIFLPFYNKRHSKSQSFN